MTTLARGALLVTLGSGVFLASGYAVNVVLGRWLGPSEYGVFGIAVAAMTLANTVQNAAVPGAVARVIARHPRSARSVVVQGAVLQVSLGATFSLLLLAGAPGLAEWFGDRRLTPALQIGAVVFPIYGLYSLAMAYHNGTRNYPRQTLVLSTYAAAKLVLAVGLSIVWRVQGAVVGYVLAPLIALVIGLRLPSAREASEGYGRLITYAFPLGIVSLVTIGQLSVDLFMVKALVAENAMAGYYTAGQNVARIPYYLLNGLAVILLPAVAGAAMKGDDDARATIRGGLSMAVIVALPSSAVIAATATPLVTALYSSEYGTAGPPTAVLAVAMGGFAVFSVTGSVVSGLGSPLLVALLGAGGLTVTVVAGLVLIPTYSMAGAAWATLLGVSVALIGGWVSLSRLAPGSLPLGGIASGLGMAGLAGLGISALNPQGWWLLPAYALVATVGALVLRGLLRSGAFGGVSLRG